MADKHGLSQDRHTAFRIEPHLKEALRNAADRDHRSIANMVAVMILEHCVRVSMGFTDAKDGGAVDERTRKNIEKQNGQPVISKEIFKKLAVKRKKKLNGD